MHMRTILKLGESLLKNVSKTYTAKFYRNQSTSNLDKHKKDMMLRGLPKIKPIVGVDHTIVVASGKGGVGKSSTAVNLAAALKSIQPDKNIGLLDLDIFGPSIPLMMNLHDTPFVTSNNLIEPLVNYGIKCMSMGFLITEGSPVIWRGLMVMQALEKLFRQVDWGTIDYMIIDTPPGTGDTLLSLIQNIPVSGSILVTTPQSAAVQVTKRGAKMFQKLNIPIIGIIENMSSVKCTVCKTDIQLFGANTTELANDLGIPILQKIPLQQEISTSLDNGTPIVVSNPNCEESTTYKNLSKQVIQFLKRK